MINLISMEEIFALLEGVRKIEIENWTKTREVEDIGDGEKKLNSEEFEGIENINIDDNNNSGIERNGDGGSGGGHLHRL